MDAIRKKMKSIKDETDQLYAIIGKFENATKEADTISKEVGINPWKIDPKRLRIVYYQSEFPARN